MVMVAAAVGFGGVGVVALASLPACGRTEEATDPGAASVDANVGTECLYQLHAGGSHTCASLNGQLWCWGSNDHGQLGLGTVDTSPHPVPVEVPLKDVRAVVAGRYHTCASRTDGTVWCWGDNTFGQVGDGTVGGSRPSPVLVAGLRNAQLTAADAHTCAWPEGGPVSCWGDNSRGQLGRGTTGAPDGKPGNVNGLVLPNSSMKVFEVQAGGRHTCAALDDLATVLCWGANDVGQLGNVGAFDTSQGTPLPVHKSSFLGVAVGGEHTCARSYTRGGEAGTTVWCWGRNVSVEDTASPTPAELLMPKSSIFDLYAGGGHTCSRLGGALYCWGLNTKGQVGDGSNASRVAGPTAVVGIASDTIEVTTGGAHSCVRAFLGNQVWCWGANEAGQLGTGSADGERHPTAERVKLVCPRPADQ
jgi:alpha-tubulin suppressor-like RCC1 family protein